MSRGGQDLRVRVGRLRVLLPTIVLTAGAAASSWFIAQRVLDHPRPIFAPIAATVGVGLTAHDRLRRSFETVFGVAFGILVADLIVSVIGRGTLQIMAVAVLAMSAAALLTARPGLIAQAGTSAVLVVTLDRPTGWAPQRFFDTLVGGCVAIVATQLFPPNPVRLVQQAARPLLDGLARALDDVAAALESGRREDARAAQRRARALDEPTRRLYAALELGQETARFAAVRRHALSELAPVQVAAAHIDHAVRNTRVLARTVLRYVRTDRPAPDGLPEAIREIAQAVRLLREELVTPTGGRPVRTHAQRAVECTGRLDAARGDMITGTISSQVHALAGDLMRSIGMPPDELRDAFETALAGQAAGEQLLPRPD
jgi:uncharacterized membrane protein YgaE (UPF0421/DUF939 family)